LENEIEVNKQRLVNESADYNTIDAFRLIDVHGQGSVSQNEIIDFLYDNVGNSLTFTQADLDLFMMRFDKYDKQKIKYSEFCTAFAPTSPRTQKILVAR
jgi:Ca2+-binding EF-hand superfamily protein